VSCNGWKFRILIHSLFFIFLRPLSGSGFLRVDLERTVFSLYGITVHHVGVWLHADVWPPFFGHTNGRVFFGRRRCAASVFVSAYLLYTYSYIICNENFFPILYISHIVLWVMCINCI